MKRIFTSKTAVTSLLLSHICFSQLAQAASPATEAALKEMKTAFGGDTVVVPDSDQADFDTWQGQLTDAKLETAFNDNAKNDKTLVYRDLESGKPADQKVFEGTSFEPSFYRIKGDIPDVH